MKISTKGRYALRLMLDLAMNGENNVVRIKDIAERQQISDKYLEQIISVLNKAGYVRSTRGPQGGYSLRKAPEEYTVGDILRLTEGSLAPVACVEEEGSCEREVDCVYRGGVEAAEPGDQRCRGSYHTGGSGCTAGREAREERS